MRKLWFYTQQGLAQKNSKTVNCILLFLPRVEKECTGQIETEHAK